MPVTLERNTRETRVRCSLDIDCRTLSVCTDAGANGDQRVVVATGIGMLDHLLTSLATHAGWALDVRAEGDLAVDDHHTAEDCAILLGQALDAALGDRSGRTRFGYAYAPLDESLARAVVDLVRRPAVRIDLGLRRERLGSLATENITHCLETLALEARCTIHVDVLAGRNDHHRAEAAFKALALAFAMALAPGRSASTKGTMVGTPESATGTRSMTDETRGASC
jgi:imidazoleglycerol-phosphate dehydratase